jgi:tetratricopeptide (TPR) repeat protein
MKSRLLALVLLAFALTPRSFAADKWTAIQTRNFLLIGNASETQIRKVGKNLEQFREAVSRLLPRARTGSSMSTVVFVFRDDASYRPFKPLYNGKPANVAGYFQGGQDVNYITLRGDEETPRTVYHEYFHLVANDTSGRLPPWLNEGFAEYYSTFLVLGNDQKVQIGRVIPEHIELLRTKSFLPLDVLFSVNQGSPYYNEEGKQGLFYAQSWALLHYIMDGEGGKRRSQFAAFQRLLEEGRPAAESIKGAFQVDASTFQKQFEQYITTQFSLPAYEYTLTDRLTFDSSYKPSLLTEAETQYYFGDLLLHLRRLEDAESYLKKSMALDGKLPGPQASLGMLRMRQGDNAEALSYLKRAAESDSKSHLAHYYYAQLLSETAGAERPNADQLNTMCAELKKAVALSPNFIPAVDLLAYVNLLRNADLPESATLLRSAIATAPGRDNLGLRLAEVLFRTREYDEAKALLQRVSASPAADDVLKGRASSLLQSIQVAEMARRSDPRSVDRVVQPLDDDRPVSPTVANSSPPRIARRDAQPAPPAVDPNLLKQANATTGKVEVVSGSTDGEIVLGLLKSLDCSNGATLSVETDRGLVTLHTDRPESIQFVSFSKAVKGEVECGPFAAPGIRVRINYKPDASGRTLGTPLVVAFVE